MKPPLRILCLGAPAPDLSTAPFGPFEVNAAAQLDAAAQALNEQPHDALLVHLGAGLAPDALLHWAAWSHAVLETAVVVVVAGPAPELALQLLQLGAQDVLGEHDATPANLARALGLSVQRKRLERSARQAFAIDLGTGLPNHLQLLEHMSHLLALRERESAPMALLVLRIEGLATVEAQLGSEAANVLRRKAAVRLRAGLRASDVVAALGADTFAVLLGWIDAAGDGARVLAKLAAALRQPFSVAGNDLALAVSAGLALYPEHGKDTNTLLHRALGQASTASAEGRVGFVNRVERGTLAAANDEGPPGK